MPSHDLRISERDWRRLRGALDGSFRSEFHEERGALALLGENNDPIHPSYTVAEVLLPEAGEVRSTEGGIVFDSRYLRRVHLRLREERLAAIATFHTHPLSNLAVSFSALVDDIEDPKLIANLIEIAPHTKLVSMVLGLQSQAGRVWFSADEMQPLGRLIVVGEQLHIIPLDGSAPPAPPPVSAVFDRALLLTPAGALNALSDMTVAIVGVSGIGSLVCELLVRAGVRRLLLIDRDVVKLVNLNRILHASVADIGSAKTDILKRSLDEIGFELSIDSVVGTVLDRSVLTRLRAADFIFGCVDRDWPRDLLADFAFRYLIPYIDLGSEIGSDIAGTTIISLDARASYLAPGRPCHLCTGVVTTRQLHFESLSKEERQREIELGYSADLILNQPAVMDLNMRAASLGTLVLRHLLQPFLQTPLPTMILENLVTFSMRAIQQARNQRTDCPLCGNNPRFGHADCAAALGYDETVLARILDAD
jgi:hypothetical protein